MSIFNHDNDPEYEARIQAWFEQYHKDEVIRKDNLHPEIRRIQDACDSLRHFCLNAMYPWNHPATHFKDSLTILGDGLPVIRFHVCTLLKGGRLKCIQKFHCTGIFGCDLNPNLMLIELDSVLIIDELIAAIHKDDSEIETFFKQSRAG